MTNIVSVWQVDATNKKSISKYFANQRDAIKQANAWSSRYKLVSIAERWFEPSAKALANLLNGKGMEWWKPRDTLYLKYREQLSLPSLIGSQEKGRDELYLVEQKATKAKRWFGSRDEASDFGERLFAEKPSIVRMYWTSTSATRPAFLKVLNGQPAHKSPFFHREKTWHLAKAGQYPDIAYRKIADQNWPEELLQALEDRGEIYLGDLYNQHLLNLARRYKNIIFSDVATNPEFSQANMMDWPPTNVHELAANVALKTKCQVA